MDASRNSGPKWLLPGLILLLGMAARLLAAARGHNYDFDSCAIVADITRHGGNVYAETSRYNYGPVWFNILHGIDALARHNPGVFRYMVAGFLGLVDAGIYFFLRRRFGELAGALFFLNPVSVIISGYHNQFGNLAILLGLLSVTLIGDDFDQPVVSGAVARRKFWGLVVLGLSLSAKHILFAFPIWLAVKQKGLFQKFIVLAVPILVFLAGFLPYWPGGSDGIIRNVFLYRSAEGRDYLYQYLAPPYLQMASSPEGAWAAFLIIGAFVFRKKSSLESLLYYTVVLVAASPAIVNQYLAIPMVFVVTHLNTFTVLYAAVATLHLLVDPEGLHIGGLGFRKCDDIAICVLFLALIWTPWRRHFLALWGECVIEAKYQLGMQSKSREP